ncbi:alpha-L-rhamnosidase C-terminal domain-containing protein [Clostridium diolis]|uniref:alpha-L-rhamnosidase-related protein n=1 Tax=Clostridium diolis TaxID=223919 RepID=UPI003AF4632D
MNIEWEENCEWIWTPDWNAEDENKIGGFVYFRKSFYIDTFNKAVVKISADSRYKLFINGKSVAIGPCKGDRFTWYYETIDISEYLKEGKNVIAVKVLRYSNGFGDNGNASVCRSPLPGLLFNCIVEDADGNAIQRICTDNSWKCMKDKSTSIAQGLYTVFLGIMEEVQAVNIPFGWELLDYDDKKWENAICHDIDTSTGRLSPWQLAERTIPLMKEEEKKFKCVERTFDSIVCKEAWNSLIKEEIPIIIPPNSKVVVELDAGELTTGFIYLSLAQGMGATIRLLCAECYEGKPYSEPWLRDKGKRTDSESGSLYGDFDIYHVSGRGCESKGELEIYEPFWFRTFRYVRVEIETDENQLKLYSVAYRETGYPLEISGEFESSDSILNKLWPVSIRTLLRCMHETYEDCPYYEQFQYAMDTRSQILFTYNISGDDRLARKTFYEFHSSLLPEGLTQSRYPSDLAQVIPGFSLYWIYMIHDHMMYYGDVQLVRRYMSSIDAILEYFHRMLDERGLVGSLPKKYWSFVDWTEEWRENSGVPTASKYGPITVYSLMYGATLHKAADLADFIGRKGIALEYRERADKISSSVIRHCKSKVKANFFTDGPGVEEFSQQTQIWAVLSKTIEGAEAKQLMEATLKDKALAECSFAMTFYLFRALSETGLYNQTYSLWKPWEKMIEEDMTTWMEDTVSKRSDCHGWGAIPLYEFGSEILGVKPKVPGYAEIIVSPTPGLLKWAKGKVVTPNGSIYVEWKQDGEELTINVDGPNEIPVTLILPDQSVRKYKSASKIQYTISHIEK